MLNYSIAMRSNPIDKGAPKKAYATSQYSEVMNINQFAEHIASHGSVYKRSDVAAILTMAVDCLREQLLEGKKVELGDLGFFYVRISGEGLLRLPSTIRHLRQEAEREMAVRRPLQGSAG